MNVKEDEREKGRAGKGAGPREGRAVRASGPGSGASAAGPGRAGPSRGSGRGSERERGRAVWYPFRLWSGVIVARGSMGGLF
jgi:hypothetical protein